MTINTTHLNTINLSAGAECYDRSEAHRIRMIESAQETVREGLDGIMTVTAATEFLIRVESGEA